MARQERARGETMMTTIEVTRRDDGTVEISEAPPTVGLSLALVAKRGATDPPWLVVEDGLVCMRGVGPGGRPREVRYRAVGFRPAPPGGEAASEGGHLICERVG